MAERKAVNKYYPPDWDPRKGSVNKRVGQHPLRDRAKKLSQGILVIRFELPYNIWCGGCGNHVGMGVRYNAEKSKVGNYYSTPIYKFRMKCHLCDNYFEIQTDPQNHDYVILCGARRKEQRWDPHENGQVVPEDRATHKKLLTDAMYKLEHGTDDKQKGTDKAKTLIDLEESRISMVDDYLLNRMARDKFRAEKHELRAIVEADNALLEKASLDLDLVDETEEDRKMAGLLKYSVTTSFEDKQKEKRKSIELRPLFKEVDTDTSSSSSTSSSASSGPSAVLPFQRHSKPELSKRGQLKQKLGWALKASYKDPFKTETKVAAINPLSTTSAAVPRAALGIKLKSTSPYSDAKGKNLEKTLSPKTGGVKTSGESSHAPSSQAADSQSKQCETSLVNTVDNELEHVQCSRLTDSSCCSSTRGMDLSSLSTSGGGKYVQFCGDGCEGSESKAGPALPSSPLLKSPSLCDRQGLNGCDRQGSNGCDTRSMSDAAEDFNSSVISNQEDATSLSATSPNASGLSALMASYTGSDSESEFSS